MEQAVAEDKLHNDHGHFSESLSIVHCRELAMKKCPTNAGILSYPISSMNFHHHILEEIVPNVSSADFR